MQWRPTRRSRAAYVLAGGSVMVIGVVGLVSTVVHHRVGGFLVALALVAVGLAVAARGWNLAVSIADRQRDRARTSEVADNS